MPCPGSPSTVLLGSGGFWMRNAKLARSLSPITKANLVVPRSFFLPVTWARPIPLPPPNAAALQHSLIFAFPIATPHCRKSEQWLKPQWQREEEGAGAQSRRMQVGWQRQRVGPQQPQQRETGAGSQRALGPSQPAQPSFSGSQHPQPPQSAVLWATGPPASLHPSPALDASTTICHGTPRGTPGPRPGLCAP